MPTALVIDDEPLIAYAIQQFQPLWEILTAPDGVTALELIHSRRDQRAPLDLVVLDLSMPHMEGRDVCARIRQLDPDLPIMPFSTFDDPAIDAYLREWGCAPLLHKSMSSHVVAAAMEYARSNRVVVSLSAATQTELQQRAAAAEKVARTMRSRWRVAVLAGSSVAALGLTQIVSITHPLAIHQATGMNDLHALLRSEHINAIILSDDQLQEVVPFALVHGIALIVIASNPPAAWNAQNILAVTTFPSAVLLEQTHLGAQLERVWVAFEAGESYVDPQIQIDKLDVILPQLTRHLRTELRRPGVSERLAEYAALLARGTPPAAIAEQMGIPRRMAYDLRYRLTQYTGLDDTALQDWVIGWYARARSRVVDS